MDSYGIYSIDDLDQRLEGMIGNIDKISFLEDYIDQSEHGSTALLAHAIESLGKLLEEEERPNGDIYRKAALVWERTAAFSEATNKKKSEKKAMKKALENYKRAASVYSREGSNALAEEMKDRILEAKKDLREGSGGRKFLVGVSIIGLLSSILFMSSNLTGFVIGDLETGGTVWTGIFLFLLGIVSLFILLRK